MYLENVSKFSHFMDTLYEYGHDLDIYKIIEKVKNAISEDTKAQRAATMAPKKLDKVQSDLIAILREGVSKRKVDKDSACGIIKVLNLPMMLTGCRPPMNW